MCAGLPRNMETIRDLVVECDSWQCNQRNGRCWKTGNKGGSKEGYSKAKWLAEYIVYQAKSQAEHEVLKEPSHTSSDLFHLTYQMKHGNLHVQDEKPVCNNTRKLCLDDRAGKSTFGWVPPIRRVRPGSSPTTTTTKISISHGSPTHIPPLSHIPLELLTEAIKLMLQVLPWPKQKCLKPLKASGSEGAQQIGDLIDDIVHFEQNPSGWEESIIIWQRPLCRASLRFCNKLHFLWWLFQLAPQDMPQCLWHSEDRYLTQKMVTHDLLGLPGAWLEWDPLFWQESLE